MNLSIHAGAFLSFFLLIATTGLEGGEERMEDEGTRAKEEEEKKLSVRES